MNRLLGDIGTEDEKRIESYETGEKLTRFYLHWEGIWELLGDSDLVAFILIHSLFLFFPDFYLFVLLLLYFV